MKKNIIKKILLRIKPYLNLIVLSIIFALTYVVLSLYIPILIGNAIDNIVGTGDVNFTVLFDILIKIAICTCVAAIAQWLMTMINNRVNFKVVKDMRADLFKHIQKLPLSYLDSNSSGNIISRMITDIDKFSDGLLLGFSQFFTGVLTILGTLIFMLWLNPLIALVVVLVTPLSFVVASFIAKRTHKMFKLQAETQGKQTAIIEETIGELKIVKAFSKEEDLLKDFDEVNENLRKYSLQAIFFSSITNPATRFVNSVVYSAVALTGSLAALSGGFTVGALTSFLAYANQYTKPFNEISSVLVELQNAIVCAGRVFEILEQEPIKEEITDKKLNNPIGEITISDVKFSYNKETELIKDLNLDVKAGQTIAIVGHTGCGKTTLINLIMRFFELDDGFIKIDGVNTSDMSRSELRSMFGMVLQDTWLKSGTIKENIALNKENASDEEVMKAARLAKAHSFIVKLPDGYDTVIGESGGNLSVGQKQLLCIARLMINLPPMLILDEATSSIDTRTEIQIQEAFHLMMQNRTTFIVAHRLSTILNSDRIIVMDNGNILEQGTHEELLKIGNHYAKLYNSQFDI